MTQPKTPPATLIDVLQARLESEPVTVAQAIAISERIAEFRKMGSHTFLTVSAPPVSTK